jgi:hypothetical protein
LRRQFALANVEAKSQHGVGTTATWGGYGGDASGRAARSARHGPCTRGAWREGSGGGRRCGDGRDHRARVVERAPWRPGPGGPTAARHGMAPDVMRHELSSSRASCARKVSK